MVAPKNDRLELVLMKGELSQTRLWVQIPAGFAQLHEFDKDKSIKIIGGAAVFLLFMLYFAPALTIMTSLVLLIILAPLAMVGMAGYSRSD